MNIFIKAVALQLLFTPPLQAAIKVSTDTILIKNIVVAVIDTGVDLSNEKFKHFLWENPGEVGLDSLGNDRRTNNIDDDGNGYIDDVNGWNFVDNNSNLKDHFGHGTHVSGLILGQDQSVISKNVKLMILKYYDTPKNKKQTPFEFSKKALNYAIKNNANIINYSGGGTLSDAEEYQILKKAESKNIIIIAAAGNEGISLEKSPYYPASYALRNIIGVGSKGPTNDKSSWSNYDKNTLFAPGENLISDLPEGKKGKMSGTSQATAWLTGFIIKNNLVPSTMNATARNEIVVAVAKLEKGLSKSVVSQIPW